MGLIKVNFPNRVVKTVPSQTLKRVLGMCTLCCGGETSMRGRPGQTVALLSGERSLCEIQGFLYEPGPKGPAFSATSRASFRFWSNSSHLERSEKQKGVTSPTEHADGGRICTSCGSAAFKGRFCKS